jgi:prophage DNA circulation protein
MSAQSDAFAAAATQLAGALVAAFNDPRDAIRLLISLTSWQPPLIPGTGPLAAEANAAQAALADNLRCAACAALAGATQAYRPSSYQDATALRTAVCDALDAQATVTADRGNDASFAALRDLRTLVSLDLAVRGAALPYFVEITTAASIPSLAEAWALYQDTTREPALVAASGVAHPLFMPLTYPGLSR